jgi:hypothetical protein
MCAGIAVPAICARAEGHFPRRIQCGYHGWTYGLDESLIGSQISTPVKVTGRNRQIQIAPKGISAKIYEMN